MKIAIFHNLEKGGALNFLTETLKYIKENNEIDVYCFKKNIPKNLVNHFYIYKIKNKKNIISNLFQIIFKIKKINWKIANKIKKKEYDLIFVYPCILTQSPYILRFLKNENNLVYFFTEPKREFYEITSFDYWSIKKILARLIRLPLKYVDLRNCQSAKHIISNSIYSKNTLTKIYNKSSTVIYPGLKPIKPQKITIKNNNKILSVGQLSKIKGHDFSIKQLKGIIGELTILGRPTKEMDKIKNIAKQNNVSLKLIRTENNKEKHEIYKKYSIYLANNNNEPFGITTLEATSNKCLVLGKKEGGTPEIIKDKVNGFLYSNLSEARKILQKIRQKKEFTFYQINKIDWGYTSVKIMEYYKKIIKNET